MKKYKYELMLFLTAMMWGLTFPASKYIGGDFDSVSYLTIRISIASVILILIFRKNLKNVTLNMGVLSFLAGVLLSVHSFILIEGLRYTSSGNSAFITSVNVVFVPILSFLFLKKKTEKGFMPCLISVVFGFLIISGILSLFPFRFNITSLNYGDLLTLIVAVLTAVYFMFMGMITEKYDAVSVNVIHMVGAAITMCAFWFFYPDKQINFGNTDTIIWIIYCAVFGTALAYYFLTKAQAKVSASKVSLICSLESVFAILFSAVIPGKDGNVEAITMNALVGGALILFGVIKVSIKNS